MKNEQILKRTDLIQNELHVRKQFFDKSQMEKIIGGYEQDIKMLKESGNQFDRIAREKMEG